MAYWSGVDVLVRIIRLALNRCWNIWWIFWCLLFPMVNTFSWKGEGVEWGWAFIIMLSQNDQNSSLLRTCSVLVAPSHSSNLQISPLVISSINITKNVPPNVSHAPPPTHPPNTYGINYLDFGWVNYTWDLGRWLSLFSL